MSLFVAVVVGYFVSVFASSNILLPLLWAWPKANRLRREGKLKTQIPATRFVVAPLVWTILIVLSLMVVAAMLPDQAYAYASGLVLGAAQIGVLVARPSQSMERDFTETYGDYISDKATKYANALLKVSVNLYEVATKPSATEALREDHAPLVLRFERPDSKLRYMAFCLGTIFYWSVEEGDTEAFHQALQDSWDHIGKMTMTAESSTFLVSGTIDRAQAIREAGAEVHQTIEDWKGLSNYLAALRAAGQSGVMNKTTARLICAMLRRIESTAALTDEDEQRLLPLVHWIEETTGVIGASVAKLAR